MCARDRVGAPCIYRYRYGGPTIEIEDDTPRIDSEGKVTGEAMTEVELSVVLLGGSTEDWLDAKSSMLLRTDTPDEPQAMKFENFAATVSRVTYCYQVLNPLLLLDPRL